MTQVINIQHWLDESGAPATPVRRQALRIARLIEYGGPLAAGYGRETLVECSRRVDRRLCTGLLWVAKATDGTLEAFCPLCRREDLVISGWADTVWAEGPMTPVSAADLEAAPPRVAN